MRAVWAKEDAKFSAKSGYVPHQVRPTAQNLHGVLITWKLEETIGNLCTDAMRHALEECFRKGSAFRDRFHAKPMYGRRAIPGAITCVLQNARKHQVPIPDSGWDPSSSARFSSGLVDAPQEEWPAILVCYFYAFARAALRSIRPHIGHLVPPRLSACAQELSATTRPNQLLPSAQALPLRQHPRPKRTRLDYALI